jgi:hypothetical protein
MISLISVVVVMGGCLLFCFIFQGDQCTCFVPSCKLLLAGEEVFWQSSSNNIQIAPLPPGSRISSSRQVNAEHSHPASTMEKLEQQISSALHETKATWA